MRSWIFRHRLRLRAIYGTRPPAPDPAAPKSVRGRSTAAPVRTLTKVERQGEHTVLRTRA